MQKLYKKIDGILHYHEAWIHDDTLIEHWGTVGDRGQTRSRAVNRNKSEDDDISAALSDATARGYRPIADVQQRSLWIEYAVVGMGTVEDVDKRYRLEDRLNETLGWTGLGECDGGSIGSGSMEVCCFVVDFDLASQVIAADLANTEFADYSRMYETPE